MIRLETTPAIARWSPSIRCNKKRTTKEFYSAISNNAIQEIFEAFLSLRLRSNYLIIFRFHFHPMLFSFAAPFNWFNLDFFCFIFHFSYWWKASWASASVDHDSQTWICSAVRFPSTNSHGEILRVQKIIILMLRSWHWVTLKVSLM